MAGGRGGIHAEDNFIALRERERLLTLIQLQSIFVLLMLYQFHLILISCIGINVLTLTENMPRKKDDALWSHETSLHWNAQCMGAAGRHRQVALGGTQPPEMPPNLSQPLGMPPKPRRNARIGWEGGERARNLSGARRFRALLAHLALLGWKAPRGTFPPDQRQSLGGSRTPRWRAAALRNPWNLSSSFKTLITLQHSKAKCPADLEETVLPVQWQSAVLSNCKENSQ